LLAVYIFICCRSLHGSVDWNGDEIKELFVGGVAPFAGAWIGGLKELF